LGFCPAARACRLNDSEQDSVEEECKVTARARNSVGHLYNVLHPERPKLCTALPAAIKNRHEQYPVLVAIKTVPLPRSHTPPLGDHALFDEYSDDAGREAESRRRKEEGEGKSTRNSHHSPFYLPAYCAASRQRRVLSSLAANQWTPNCPMPWHNTCAS